MSIFHKAVLGNSAFQPDRRAIAFGKKKSPLNPFEDFMIGGCVAGVSKTIVSVYAG